MSQSNLRRGAFVIWGGERRVNGFYFPQIAQIYIWVDASKHLNALHQKNLRNLRGNLRNLRGNKQHDLLNF
jgi:hypothetical protein